MAKPLTTLINLSIKTSTFPVLWQRARIVPIFKKGDKSCVDNYRPIAVLSNFAKVYESVIYSCIYSNIKSQISDYQHGFIRSKSTVTNLVSISQFISCELDKRGQVDVIYTDFSSAFDTVNHQTLLLKLSAFGCSPSLFTLLHSYLTGRSSYVYYNGYKSYEFIPLSGVPQGSNLGPLLFVAYINDLLVSLSCPVLAYADDLKIYLSIKSYSDVLQLQCNLDLISEWSSHSGVHLNKNKCCYVSYTRRASIFPSTYWIGDHSLNRLQQFRDLGVIFDSRLTFSPHISNLTMLASRSLGFIIRCSRYFNDAYLLKSLFFSFVMSKLEYASPVWCPYYIHLEICIEKVQRRFLKYMSFKIDGVYPTRGVDYSELLNRHNVSSLSQRREIQGAHFVWKLVNGFIIDSSLLACLNFHIPRLNSRFVSTFTLPAPRTNLLRGSPIARMCRSANLVYNDIFFDKM